MNRSEFIDIVRSGGRARVADPSALSDIVDSYPYFQSAYTLMLNSLFRSDSIGFEEKLKRSAIFIADREVLYTILKSAGELPMDGAIPRQNKGEASAAPIVEQSPDKGEEPGAGVIGESSSRLFEPVSGRSREELVSEIETRLREINGAGEEPAEEDTRDEMLLIEDNQPQPIEEIVTSEEPADSATGDRELLDLDWGGEVKADGNSESGPSSQNDLIDRFIELNPRIEPIREAVAARPAETEPDTDEEDAGLVTETLAKIYLNQGYYTRAIMIYEKLCLKFPEKSSYFATQIETIKELIK